MKVTISISGKEGGFQIVCDQMSAAHKLWNLFTQTLEEEMPERIEITFEKGSGEK